MLGPSAGRRLSRVSVSGLVAALAGLTFLPAPVRAQTVTVDLQAIFDAGHNLGALFGDLRREWAGMGPPMVLGPDAGLYPLWASQAMGSWNGGNAVMGVVVPDIEVAVSSQGEPGGMEAATRTIRFALQGIECDALEPPDLPLLIFEAGLMLAQEFYVARRTPYVCADCMRDILGRAAQNLRRAAATFPRLAAIADALPSAVRGFNTDVAPIEAAIQAVNDVLPDGAIFCSGATSEPVPSPAADGTFYLYDIAYDEALARELGIEVTVNSVGGLLQSRWSMDGRCADSYAVDWSFTRALDAIQMGDRFAAALRVDVIGNCPESSRSALAVEARGYVHAAAIPPSSARRSVGEDRINLGGGGCGNLGINRGAPAVAFAGGGRPMTARAEFTVDGRVIRPDEPCAFAFFWIELRLRGARQPLQIVYHFERASR